MKILFVLLLGFVSSINIISAQTSAQKTVRADSGHDLRDISSHVYGVEAEITSIERNERNIESVVLKVVKPLPTSYGWTPYDKPGDVFTIQFNEPSSKLGHLVLTNGTVIKVNFGMIDYSTGQWGSNFSWLYVKSHDTFYNVNGKKVEGVPPIY